MYRPNAVTHTESQPRAPTPHTAQPRIHAMARTAGELYFCGCSLDFAWLQPAGDQALGHDHLKHAIHKLARRHAAVVRDVGELHHLLNCEQMEAQLRADGMHSVPPPTELVAATGDVVVVAGGPSVGPTVVSSGAVLAWWEANLTDR